MIGQTLGHYRIDEKIGAGGMGVVYRAHDDRLDRAVAIKVLRPGTLSDETARKQFRKEALALAKLSHPNIGVIHDFDTQDGTDFLVMELIVGSPLDQKLAGGALPEKELLQIGMQIAAALEEAHDRGVVHRDLKPGNTVVTPKGQVKVLDFGLAKFVRVAAEAELTASVAETRAVTGTLPYMAPEQLRGEAVDARADIYALGVVLYEMATGQRPFQMETGPRLTDAILHQPPVALRALNARVSPELERIILKCLEKDPEDRYQSAKELLVDLRRLSAPSTLLVAQPKRKPGRFVVPAVIVAGALLVVFGLNVRGLRDRLLGGAGPQQIRSLAVLPLENLSQDPEQEYFADGMTEALITDLSKIRALRVISRTSVMQYKATKKTLPQIAQELDVDGIVEGSVLRDGNRVRITAQLIRAAPERHLWASSYDRELRDILALQSEVARAIVTEIRVTVTPAEQAELARVRPVHPEAHEAYLKGRHFLSTGQGRAQGTKNLQRAIQLDPNYAPAFAALAESFAFSLPAHENMPKARGAAQRALELDDSLAEAHAILGLVKMYYDWDWAGADAEFRRALELNPGSATAHSRYAIFCWAMGRFDEAIQHSERAQKLDPVGIIVNTDLGRSYYFARQYDRAIEQFKKTIELDPNNAAPHFFLGIVYEQKGMLPEAISEIIKSRELGNDRELAEKMKTAYAHGGYSAFLLAWAQTWESYVPQYRAQAYSVGVVYCRAGENDKAIAWLEKAFQEHARALVYLRFEPQLDPLRSDARFQDIVRRMKFP